jgi:hypothetical protein
MKTGLSIPEYSQDQKEDHPQRTMVNLVRGSQ